MILHTLISIKTIIGENNVRSMTFITMLFHLPNNMSKSFGTTYYEKKVFYYGNQKKIIIIIIIPGKNATKIRIMYHEVCYSHH